MQSPNAMPQGIGEHAAANEKGLTAANDQALRDTTTNENCSTRPSIPNAGTQEARLLDVLRSGRGVDPLQAWAQLGIYRLSDCVFNLRRRGWPVVTERIDVQNRYGEACHVARYRLEVQP